MAYIDFILIQHRRNQHSCVYNMNLLEQTKINPYQLFPNVKIKHVIKHSYKMCNFKLYTEFIKSLPNFKFDFPTRIYKI